MTMKKLFSSVMNFLHNQGCVVVSTVEEDGSIHVSCKGIVECDASGKVYLFDLYKGRTQANLKRNPHITITAVDEHRFSGYALKGRAHTIAAADVNPRVMKAWEDMLARRLTRRVIRNVKEEKGHPSHPEAMLPDPEYMVVMNVEEVIDLTPPDLRAS